MDQHTHDTTTYIPCHYPTNRTPRTDDERREIARRVADKFSDRINNAVDPDDMIFCHHNINVLEAIAVLGIDDVHRIVKTVAYFYGVEVCK